MTLAEKLFDLSGRVIIVTGAAGAIGQSVCRVLAAQGADIAATDIDKERLESFVAGLNSSGKGRHKAFVADAANEDDLRRLVDSVVEEYGKITGLVNNVGAKKASPIWKSDTREMVESYVLNCVSAYNLTRFCMPYLQKETGASVLFSGSMVGSAPGPEYIEYSNGKAALINMMRSMAVVSGPSVRFNAVIIGAIEDESYKEYDSESVRSNSRGIVMDRLGRPSDVAHAFLFLMSDAASWITGAELRVDGGGRYVEP